MKQSFKYYKINFYKNSGKNNFLKTFKDFSPRIYLEFATIYVALTVLLWYIAKERGFNIFYTNSDYISFY